MYFGSSEARQVGYITVALEIILDRNAVLLQEGLFIFLF